MMRVSCSEGYRCRDFGSTFVRYINSPNNRKNRVMSAACLSSSVNSYPWVGAGPYGWAGHRQCFTVFSGGFSLINKSFFCPSLHHHKQVNVTPRNDSASGLVVISKCLRIYLLLVFSDVFHVISVDETVVN